MAKKITLKNTWYNRLGMWLFALSSRLIIRLKTIGQRMRGCWIILTSKQFTAFGMSVHQDQEKIKTTRREASNMSNQLVFMVPYNTKGMDATIKRLKSIRKDMVNHSEYHKSRGKIKPMYGTK